MGCSFHQYNLQNAHRNSLLVDAVLPTQQPQPEPTSVSYYDEHDLHGWGKEVLFFSLLYSHSLNH